METIFGYARCSTNEKRQDINRQKRELMEMGVVDAENIYWEYESGAKTNRIQLNRLFEAAQPGDTIVTVEVSRLTRSTVHLCEILQMIQDKKLCLKIGAFVADCRSDDIDPMTKGMLMMWGVFAEMERDIIKQRVRSGLANARAKGKVLGRPKMEKERLPKDFVRYYPLYKEKKLTLKGLAGMIGCSRQTAYRYIRLYENFEETELK